MSSFDKLVVMPIRKAYRVRLYPTQTQVTELIRILGAARFVYNHYLEQRIKYHADTGKTLSLNLMSADLTKLRHDTDWMRGIQLEPLGQSLRRLDRSFRYFFRRKHGFPNFHSKKDAKQSFQKHLAWRVVANKIYIQNNLHIKFRGSIGGGTHGTLVVSRHPSGKWFATITATVGVKAPKRYTKPIGLDLGLTHVAITNTGKKYDRVPDTLQPSLKRAQRTLARSKRGSNRREKARVEVARVYERIANKRSNHLHQISHAITAKNHSLIAVEDLNVKGMVKNRRLSYALHNAAFRELVRQLEYKQSWKGGEFIKVPRFFPSSKTCSKCSAVAPEMPLSVRRWRCVCGTRHDRDINAAKNILNYALAHRVRGETVSPSRLVSMKRGRSITKSDAKREGRGLLPLIEKRN